MLRLVPLLALAGCATASLPSGPAPKLNVTRTASLELAVSGNDKAEFDAYIDWILKENGQLRRVQSGGDARIAVTATLDRSTLILGGTDLTLTVRVNDESRTWKRSGLTSGVPSALDEMTTDAALWALGKAATPGSSFVPTEPPPRPPVPEVAPSSTPSPVDDTPSPSHKKKRHK